MPIIAAGAGGGACQPGATRNSAPAAMSTAASTVSTASLRVVCMADSSLSAC